ncbi:MAG: hypothetical protein ACRBB0_08655 [Pelagimonas sp.]|uniref:hypothetical protein n=1 Tax=Pelagimonas sp. TaxID=2073170 RepID=UPI003D6B6E31
MKHTYTLRTALILGATFLAHAAVGQDTPRDQQAPMNFEGQYIASVSDADMVASAYVDGRLGPNEGHDTLSIVQLSHDPSDLRAVEVPASNSVAGPPASLDITPDGKYAFVIETWTARPDTMTDARFSDLSPGDLLQVFDMKDPTAPTLISQTKIPLRPDAIRVNHDGSLIAVTFHNNGGGATSPLALFPFREGTLGEPVFPDVPGWKNTDRMIDVDWHPQRNILAILDETGATLRFAEVGETLDVEVIGNVVGIEKAPFRAEFTPDGQHVVVNAVYWGNDIAGRWIEAPRGSVLTVRMNADTTEGKVRHAMVSTIKTGVSPEGLAVSPDGKWVVTTNLERSYLPYNDPRITWYSSLTLVHLDSTTGQLEKVADFAYDGILPEAAVFDNSSRYIAVANYDHFDDRKVGGSIDFWRIETDPLDASTTHLVKTERSIPVTRGVHSMAIAR